MEAGNNENEKLLVTVGHGPHSDELIRECKQMATLMQSPWIALHVDTGRELSKEDKRTIKRNLDLARELGAEVHAISDGDLASGINRFCRNFQITSVLFGQPLYGHLRLFFSGGNIVERFSKLNPSVKIYIIGQKIKTKVEQKRTIDSQVEENKKIGLRSYLIASFYIISIGTLNAVLFHVLHLLPYRSIGLIFLLAVSMAGRYFSIGPTILVSLLSLQIWNVFFIPPIFTFHMDDPEDIFLSLSFFFVATISGLMTSLSRRNQKLLYRQKEMTSALYKISLNIVQGTERGSVLSGFTKDLSNYFKGQCAVALKNSDNVLAHFPRGEDWLFNRSKEWEVATWCFVNGRIAGRWTDTLNRANGFYVPLKAIDEVVGVFAYSPKDRDDLSVNEREMVITLCSQLAMYLQREMYQEKASESERLKTSERIHQTLLNSVSHEIKTPLTAIMTTAEAMKSKPDDKVLKDLLIPSLVDASKRLKRVVDNILDMSRLENGVLGLKSDWVDVNDVLENAKNGIADQLGQKQLVFVIQEEFPLIKIDALLLEQVVMNLILNAIQHSPDFGKIAVKVSFNQNQWSLRVEDEGSGIPNESKELIFSKFYRIHPERRGGSGLGLSIAKSIIELHAGQIIAKNNDQGGACIEFVIPRAENPPPMPEEN
ncbi:MAG: hypothetical protein COW00_01985 [Bdellovibrio sp. CG12_big_fil_rev_8_21_14_0_65_39_13]|nr:MAG: hypothetical protein COW78_14245 [Bdellovibrio sp. CG22_combo_CG10-13_8_21_14_all_39_27]PIQ62153.1 MAG: hypothetical protein COW00_01985 [Bdellovibrio sp. CG12_big_fil_rev_8_21_14_0_65_39_13]PIR34166.1 MAG: hypothetical protein COV37_13730 [Bdellovibrio sp. CG11_big_fil_rev_8_21_14_0_20_39_38]